MGLTKVAADPEKVSLCLGKVAVDPENLSPQSQISLSILPSYFAVHSLLGTPNGE